SSPGPSHIKAVENYCASIRPQLIHHVKCYTQSYPMRNPTDSKELCTKLYNRNWGNIQSWQEFECFCKYHPVEVSVLICLVDVREPCQLGCRNLTYYTNFNNR
ncbi:hypothetical protein HPG69_018203, partial [Diceros bicornis minor]